MAEVGPGSMRVGRLIGRLGVVTMPAIERGLGLADRVVRRHVAKLEAIGWCARTPGLRGYGSLVWMTDTGLNGIGLVDLPALRAPDPFSIQTMRTVRVAWVAAEIEAAGHRWKAVRELALAPDRWGVQVANERGGKSRRLPDLVFWPASGDGLPVAVVVVHGPPKPRRERAALEGWQGSIAAGQYAQVRYVAGPSSARRREGVAARVGLTATQLIAGDRAVKHESPVPAETIESLAEASTSAEVTAVAVPVPPQPVPDPPPPVPGHAPRQSRLHAPAETPERAAERQELIRELLGQEETPSRRRWRRRSP